MIFIRDQHWHWMSVSVLLAIVTTVCATTAVNTDRYDYALKVENSSPAVIDSNVTFMASLHHKDGSPANDNFRFEWMTKACDIGWPKICTNSTFGKSLSTLTRVFTRFNVFSRPYWMDVDVYLNSSKEEDSKKPVASGGTWFNFTDTLNGNLKVKQHSAFGVLSETVAVRRNTTFVANVTDAFSDVALSYTWRLTPVDTNDTYTWRSTNANVTLVVNNTGRYLVESDVLATITVLDELHVNHTYQRNGTFTTRITVKDVVSNLNIRGVNDYRPGHTVRVNASCRGSPPFNILWSLADPMSTASIWQNESTESCFINMTFPNLTENGVYTLHMISENEVSRAANYFQFAISNPIPATPWFLVLFIVLIGCLSVAAMLLAYNRDRRPPPVETADFHFRSRSVEDLSRQPFFDKISDFFNKLLPSRANVDRAHGCHQAGRRDTSMYGALEDSRRDYDSTSGSTLII